MLKIKPISFELAEDGGILIRDAAGHVIELAPPGVDEILGEVGQIPAWIAKPSGGYTENARVYNDADQEIPRNNWTALTYNQERYDTDEIHSTVINNSRLTCKTAGKYMITTQFHLEVQPASRLQGGIKLNGTTWIAVQALPSPILLGLHMNFSTQYDLEVNDFVETFCLHSNALPTDVDSAANYSPEFMMARVG